MDLSKAFTLVELLVVIAIIGILASIVTVSLAGANKRAIDAEIKTLVRQYKTLMDLERSEGGTGAKLYTTGATGWVPLSSTCAQIGTSGGTPVSTHLASAITLCDQILSGNSKAAGTNLWVGNSGSSTVPYRIIASLASDQGRYFCINGLGEVSEQNLVPAVWVAACR